MTQRKILVTGATGFLGRHMMPVLRAAYPEREIVGVSSVDGDLTRFEVARALLDKVRPDAVIHLAAYSGGIGANRSWPADFYWRNITLVSNIYEAAAQTGVKRIVYTMGGCSYPGTATSPISEDQMWEGYPQGDSAAYSAAKKMGIVAAKAYEAQHGISSTVLVPGNLFGEYDNYRNGESHVIPAFLRRFHEAKLAGVSEVVCWGRGIAQRDFVYAEDVARAIPQFLDRTDVPGPVNLSHGATTTIRELAETVADVVGLKAEIKWDLDKPEGQLIKIFDVARMREMGIDCPTGLREGLVRTYDWFQRNYADAGDGLRL
ncbi:GDP-fucose synthetase [Caulobacter sp. Root656]|nr:GDP-fucose synthetase [Caulobacter sp. Root656]